MSGLLNTKRLFCCCVIGLLLQGSGCVQLDLTSWGKRNSIGCDQALASVSLPNAESEPFAWDLVPGLPSDPAPCRPLAAGQKGTLQLVSGTAPLIAPQPPLPPAPAGNDCVDTATVERLLEQQSNQLEAKLTAKLQELEEQLASSRTETARLQAELTTARAETDQLRTEVIRWQTEVTRLQTDFNRQQAEDLKSLDTLLELLQSLSPTEEPAHPLPPEPSTASVDSPMAS